MSIKNIVVFCLGFIVCGCNIRNRSSFHVPEVIHVNPLEVEEEISLSAIADSIICVRLQCDTSDVIGRVREITLREKYIYVQDVTQQCIFVFDKAGNFVSKLDKRGEGPEEYHWLGPFYIGEKEQYIEIIDRAVEPSKLKKYSLPDFRFLGESSIINASYNSSRCQDGYYYFATQQIDNVVEEGEKTNAGLIIWDTHKQIAKTFFDKEIETGHSSFCPNIESFTKNRDGELFISMMYDNTFYQLKKDSVIPVCTVDFGIYNMDNSIGNKSLKRQISYIENASQRAFFPVLTMNDENIFAFSYYFKKEGDRFFREADYRSYIKFKSCGKAFHGERIKNDLTDFPDYLYISSYFFDCAHEVWLGDDSLVDIVYPALYFQDKSVDRVFVDGLGEITSEDNPIILIIKLKRELLNINHLK